MRHITILLIVFLLIPVACRDDRTDILPPPRPHPATIQLTAEDVGVTDITLKISIAKDNYPRTFKLMRDTTIILTKTLISNDTVIIDRGRLWGLLPKQTYKYTLIRYLDRRREDIINIYVTTMDTTSHNFTWEIDTLGDGASSVLRDVAIINDTCIIAVGEISVKDTVGNWINPPFNMARWNGREWKLIRVMYNYQGLDYFAPLYSIFIFSVNDYWVGSNQPMHWNGTKWETFDLGNNIWNGWINKIWGSSSKDIYIVGANGVIARYDGSTWQKMESGTDVDLTDVWGSPDGSIVWACGFYHSRRGTYLLRHTVQTSEWTIAYDGSEAETIIRSDSLSGAYASVYSPNKQRIYVGSHAGIYLTRPETYGAAKRLSFTSTFFPGFPNRLRGNDANDLVIVGNYNFVAHFNGVSWRHFQELNNQDKDMSSVDQKGNLIVAVGFLYDPINSIGIVLRGRR